MRPLGFVFRREAMGFGDVTLMGMIGAFLGWQAAVLTFFLAPFLGLAHAAWKLLKYLKKRISGGQLSGADREIPYGPYLSMAAATLFFLWKWIVADLRSGSLQPSLRDILVDVGHQRRPAGLSCARLRRRMTTRAVIVFSPPEALRSGNRLPDSESSPWLTNTKDENRRFIRNFWVYRRLIGTAILLGLMLWFIWANDAK